MAETELRKTLEMDPNNGGVDYMLYFTLANKKNNSAALFYSARAAAYDGAGSLAPSQRQAVGLAERSEVGARSAAAVHVTGVEQRPDLPHRRCHLSVPVAVHERGAGCRPGTR